MQMNDFETFHWETRGDINSCFICGINEYSDVGMYKWYEWHHVWGASNRKNSEKYGCKVYLCHNCHNEPPNGVHHNKAVNDQLKKECQEWLMRKEGWKTQRFVSLFGKNYMDGWIE